MDAAAAVRGSFERGLGMEVRMALTVCLARSLPQNWQLLGIRCSHGLIMNQSEAIVNTSILVRTPSKWSRYGVRLAGGCAPAAALWRAKGLMANASA